MVEVCYLNVTKKAYGRHLSEHGNELWMLWHAREVLLWLPTRQLASEGHSFKELAEKVQDSITKHITQHYHCTWKIGEDNETVFIETHTRVGACKQSSMGHFPWWKS
jgi:hypothetical protein